MKKQFFKTTLLAVSCSLALLACNRNKVDATPDDTQDQVTASSDASDVNSALDKILDDANNVISGSSLSGARTDGNLICGASIDTSLKSSGIIKLTFDGTTICVNGTRTRSGIIILTLSSGKKWADEGAILSIALDNYKVTKVANGKSLTFNGTKTVTNITGGLIRNLSDGGASVVHKVRGSLGITFDDGTERTWQVARQRTVALSNAIYKISIAGDTTILGRTNIDVWGSNRRGNGFYAELTEPVVLSSGCNYNAISGIMVHKGLAREITVTFGVDQSGHKVTAGDCPYGFELMWVNAKGVTRSLVEAYQ